MKVEVSEATGPALRYMVALTRAPEIADMPHAWAAIEYFHPTTNWAQGGPIIDREGISTTDQHGCHGVGKWMASLRLPEDGGMVIEWGPTPLIAAMRCYVASKLGDTAEVPEELI
jgi:hypothetical protein